MRIGRWPQGRGSSGREGGVVCTESMVDNGEGDMDALELENDDVCTA